MVVWYIKLETCGEVPLGLTGPLGRLVHVERRRLALLKGHEPARAVGEGRRGGRRWAVGVGEGRLRVRVGVVGAARAAAARLGMYTSQLLGETSIGGRRHIVGAASAVQRVLVSRRCRLPCPPERRQRLRVAAKLPLPVLVRDPGD